MPEETQNDDRHTGGSHIHLLALIIQHSTDLAVAAAGRYVIADMKGTLLDQDSRDGTAGIVQLSLNDKAAGITVGISLELMHLGNQKQHFQQFFDTVTFTCTCSYKDCVSAPFFWN